MCCIPTGKVHAWWENETVEKASTSRGYRGPIEFTRLWMITGSVEDISSQLIRATVQ